jgi:hypothetical protein
MDLSKGKWTRDLEIIIIIYFNCKWVFTRWNDWQEKPKYSEKTCPSSALSTTNPTCCPDANPGRQDGKPATLGLNLGITKQDDDEIIANKVY